MDMQNVSSLTIPEGEVKAIHNSNNQLLWGRVNYNTRYVGDTFQQTYSGKNLIDGANPTYANFATASLSNNVITISSTATATVPYVGWVIDNLSANDVVRYSGVIMDSNGQIVLQYDNNGTWVTISGSIRKYTGGTTPATFAWTNTANTTKVRFLLYANKTIPTGNSSSRYKNAILTVNNSDLSYEPYVGGIPSPNPDYPQDVNVVTGEQTVNVSGKNLLNASADTGSLNNVNYIKNGDGTYTVNGTANGTSSFVVGSIELTANTQYVVSGCPGTGSGSSYNVRIRDANYTALGFDVGNGVTITPTETKTYYYQITVVSGYSVSNLVFKPMICKLQVEEGTVATAYEPYQSQSYPISLGSTELCKIGDYQDYIYEGNDGWYLHKEIRHLSLPIADMDNSESYPGWRNQGVILNDLPAMNNGLKTATHYYCNVTVYDAYTESGAAIYASNIGSGISAGGLVMLLNTGLTQTQLKNRYPNLVIEVYYGIVNPIADTQITNTTLVAQLNAVHEWLTRYGYNATVSGDLPIVLQRDSLQ